MKIHSTPEAVALYLAEAFQLKNVTCVSWGIKASGFALFTADRESTPIFVKWGGKPGCCRNDHTYTSRLHGINPGYFLRPYFYSEEGGVRCFGMERFTGRTLKQALDTGSLSLSDKADIVRALPLIAKCLIDANCVHRDIKPDNFALLQGGGIKLFDFEFATDAEGYKEREEIVRCPNLISCVGTKSESGVSLGIGRFMWDDMVVFRRILHRIGPTDEYADAYAEADAYFQEQEGKRTLHMPGRIGFMVRRRFYKVLSCLVPVKSWRHGLRNKYKTPLY